MSKKNSIILSIGVLIFVALSVTFFFFDLDISIALAKENPNFLYVLLAAVGEFPIYIGPILFGLVYGFTSENKNMRLVSHLVGLIAIYIAFIRLTNGIFENFFSSNLGMLQFSLLSLAALFTYVFLFVVFNKIDKEKLYKLRDISLMYLIVSISSFAIVSGLKLVWGRVRFRALSSDYGEYSNFLTVHGFNNSSLGDDYRSFPSGHTNSATSILLLSLIPARFTSKKWIKYLVSVACLIYPIIVALSRIGVGAHYASDVLFGFGISASCFILTYIIFKKKGWLYARSNKC